MYNLSYFKEPEKQILLEFMGNNPFAFLTGSSLSGKQVATQIPILLEERDGDLYLQGHIMRQTDHHKALLENPQALVVFSGPHTYVSASWYTNPQIGSTWNYMSIHISGTVNFLPDEGLIKLMKKLTLLFEDNNTASPTFYDNLPESFLKKMLPAIVAFEIKVTEIQNVFKLSQNRDEQSYRTIIKKLQEKNDKGNAFLIAEEMEKRFSQLFPEGVEWDGSKFLS